MPQAKPMIKPKLKPKATGSKMWIWITLILVAISIVIIVVVAVVLMSGGTAGQSGTWRDIGCPYQGTSGQCSYDLWCDPGETPSDCPSDCDLGGAGMEGALKDCLEQPTEVEWDTCVASVAYYYDELILCNCILDSYLSDFCKDAISGDINWDDYY